MTLISKVQSYINKHNLCQKSDTIILAISGGLDSMCLLDIMRNLNFSINVAHVNFQLRNEESDLDEKLVKQYCRMYDIPIFVHASNTQSYSKHNKIGIQEAAREIRYKWFNELMLAENFNVLMTAHHKDDIVETMMINLIRGTGSKGLLALSNQNKVVRPLLEFNKEELKSYALSQGLKWREDISNQENKYLRNGIRNRVLPILKDVDDRAVDGFIKSQNNIFEEHTLLNYLIDQEVGNIWQINEENKFLKMDALVRYPKPDYMLYILLKEFGFNRSQASDLWYSKDESGKIFIAEKYQTLLNRGSLFLKKNREDLLINLTVDLNNNKEYIFNETKLSFNIDAEFQKGLSNNIAFLNMEKLGKLSVRNPKPGDSFIPLGMKGRKKLQDFFTDIKLNLFEKEKVLLLISDNEIAWVMGYRISDKFRVINESNVLKVELLNYINE